MKKKALFFTLNAFTFLFFPDLLPAQSISSIDIDSWKNGTWVHKNTIEYTYDANGYLIKTFSYTGSKSSYTSATEVTFTNNSSGKPLSEIDRTYSNGNWTNSSKTTYTYNSSGYKTEMLTQTWDTTNNVYVNNAKTIYTIGPGGKPSQLLTSYWWAGGWLADLKETFSYDSLNNQTGALIYYWNGVSNFTLTYKHTDTYNGSNQLVHELSLDSISVSWDSTRQTTYSYNSNGEIDIVVTQSYDSGWVNDTRKTYHYNTPTGILSAKVPAELFETYPNPSEDIVHVNLGESYTYGTLTLKDSRGITVKQESFSLSTTSFDISCLSSGVYYLTVESNGQRKTSVIVKK